MGSGVLTMVLVGTIFSLNVQGFYYVFASIVGALVFLELGFGQSVQQFVIHEFAHLHFQDGRLEGEPVALARILSLGRLILHWYSGIAVLFFVLVGSGGYLFFEHTDKTGVHWSGPWWAFMAALSLNLLLLPLWFFLEGCNRIASVNQYRFIAGIVATLLTWLAILDRWELWAACVWHLTMFAAGLVYVARRWWPLVWQIQTERLATEPVKLAEIWPFQWRIAVSWCCGYFVFSLFNPVMWYFHGAASAGRMGMTRQAVDAVASLATAWTQTKVPQFGMLIKDRRFAELDRLFRLSTLQGLGVCVAGGMAALALVAGLKMLSPLGSRFLDLTSLSLLIVGGTANYLITSMAFYLRAHKQEPYMGLSAVTALIVASLVVGLGALYGPLGAVLGYTSVVLCLTLPGAAWIFVKRRREWHQPHP